jgi:hypothetical protein
MGFQAPPQMTDTSTTSTTQQGLGLYGLKTPPSSLTASLTFAFHAAPGPSHASSLFSFIFR